MAVGFSKAYKIVDEDYQKLIELINAMLDKRLPLNFIIHCRNLLSVIISDDLPASTTLKDKTYNFDNDVEHILELYSHCTIIKDIAREIVRKCKNHKNSWIFDIVKTLSKDCLAVIEKNADTILKQEAFLGLHYETVFEILTGDSFKISNEVLVYFAVVKWYKMRFKEKLVPTSDHFQRLLHAARFELMTEDEFLCSIKDDIPSPVNSGYLSQIECEEILAYIRQTKPKEKPERFFYQGPRFHHRLTN